MGTISGGTTTSYCGATSFTVSSSTATYNAVTYTADLNHNKFISNTYNGNFYSNGYSLIQLDGVPRISMSGETFSNNGDASRESIIKYGTNIMSPATSEMTISASITSPGSYSSSSLG